MATDQDEIIKLLSHLTGVEPIKQSNYYWFEIHSIDFKGQIFEVFSNSRRRWRTLSWTGDKDRKCLSEGETWRKAMVLLLDRILMAACAQFPTRTNPRLQVGRHGFVTANKIHALAHEVVSLIVRLLCEISSKEQLPEFLLRLKAEYEGWLGDWKFPRTT